MRLANAAAMLAAAALTCTANAVRADTLNSEQIATLGVEPQDFTCPLGGESFAQVVQYPHFPLSPFPDGSHMGDNWIEQQIVQCPANGLLLIPDFEEMQEQNSFEPIYHQYTAAELSLLPALLDDGEWRALSSATRQLRAYWLANRLDLSRGLQQRLLIQSTYGAQTEEARDLSNQAIARDLPGLLDLAADEDERLFLEDRVIDALRQLGRFDEARALLRRYETDYFARTGEEPLADEDHEITPLELALDQRNSDRFALVMLEGRQRSLVCNDYSELIYRFSPRLAADCAGREESDGSVTSSAEAANAAVDEAAAGW